MTAMPSSEQAELLKYQIKALEEKLELETKAREKTDRQVQDLLDQRGKALVWGITTLGTLVVGLVGWIGSLLVGGHFK